MRDFLCVSVVSCCATRFLFMWAYPGLMSGAIVWRPCGAEFYQPLAAPR